MNRICNSWDEYAGEETRHAEMKGRVRVSEHEASDCPTYQEYDGVSRCFKVSAHQIRHGHTDVGGEEAHKKDV